MVDHSFDEPLPKLGGVRIAGPRRRVPPLFPVLSPSGIDFDLILGDPPEYGRPMRA